MKELSPENSMEVSMEVPVFAVELPLLASVGFTPLVLVLLMLALPCSNVLAV